MINSDTQLNRKNDILAVFAWTWAVALLFHVVQSSGPYGLAALFPSKLALFVCSVALLYNPYSITLLLLTFGLNLLDAWFVMPGVSNHRFIEILFSLSVLVPLAGLVVKRRTLRMEDYYQLIAPLGRWFLVIMYFFGVFHKLNTGWFNLETSCAVALWRDFYYPLPDALRDNTWLHYAAIYGTLIVETVIVAALLWGGRASKYAVLSGLVFHGAIGLNAYADYWNFSALSFALHMLFLSPHTLPRCREFCGNHAVVSKLHIHYLATIVTCCFTVFAFLISEGAKEPVYLFWICYAAGILVFVLRFAHYEKSLPWSGCGLFVVRPAWGYLGVAAFILNCFSPYFGYKTDSTISMYSNLNTEMGYSNHLLLPYPIALFPYQEQVVTIKNSSVKSLAGKTMLLVQLRQALGALENTDHFWIRYEQDGVLIEYTSYEQADAGLQITASPLLNRLGHFKPLDLSMSGKCTH